MEGGHALAEVLFGGVNPSGKLPFTVPEDQADLPPFDPFAERADYGRYHGYTLFEKMSHPVAYPFGHGLSYTRFVVRDLQITTPRVSPGGVVTVRATVHNVGQRAGAEVVQLYVGFPGSRVERPVKLLRGFAKAHLAPNVAQTIDFAVPAADLAYWDTQASEWVVEAMDYEVMVGCSSADPAALVGTFTVSEPAPSRRPSAALQEGHDQPTEPVADAAPNHEVDEAAQRDP
jgi:beta-glucosidase